MMQTQPTLKSSVLSTNGGKLTAQLLVQDHLVNHYKKLQKVKPSVDTSAPKIWLARKKGHAQSAKGMSPVSTFRPQLTDAYYDDYGENFEPALPLAASAPHIATGQYRYDSRDGPVRSRSARVHSPHYGSENGLQVTSSQTWRAAMEFYSKTGVEPPKYDGNDLIEKHREYFRKEKLFTPRTLHTSQVKSRLSTMPSCYNNPKISRSRSRQDSNTENGAENAELGATTTMGPEQTGSRPNTGAALSDSLMNDTLRSHDGRPKGTPSGVPPLKITLDADNLQWLKEKSQKSRFIKLGSTNGKRPGSTSGGGAGNVSMQTGAGRNEVDADKIPPETSVVTKPTLMPRELEAGRRHHVANEEDQKYQDFVQEVIADILDRGIFTNWGLKQVFESHIEKHLDDLDEDTMRRLLEELRRKLGVPLERESSSHNDFGFGSTLPPAALDNAAITNGDRFTIDNDDKSDQIIVTKPKPNELSPTAIGHRDVARVGRPPLPKAARRESRDEAIRVPVVVTQQADVLEVIHDEIRRAGSRGDSFSEPESEMADQSDAGYDELDACFDLGKTIPVLPLQASVLSNGKSDMVVSENGLAQFKRSRFRRTKEVEVKPKSTESDKPDGKLNEEPTAKRDVSFHENVAPDATVSLTALVDATSPKHTVSDVSNNEDAEGSNKDEQYEDDYSDDDEAEEDSNEETNPSMLDTITEYQQKLERTNFKDEGSDGELDVTLTGRESPKSPAPNSSQPEEPEDGRVSARSGEHRQRKGLENGDDVGAQSDNQHESTNSIDVSDLDVDENEIIG